VGGKRSGHRRLGPQLGRVRQDVTLSADLPPWARDLTTAPPASGGLLVRRAPEALDAVLSVFRAEGFEEAAAVGRTEPGPPVLRMAA